MVYAAYHPPPYCNLKTENGEDFNKTIHLTKGTKLNFKILGERYIFDPEDFFEGYNLQYDIDNYISWNKWVDI